MHFRQEALVRKLKYALPWASLRIALLTFRSHETCKVEIQYLKSHQESQKNCVNVEHFCLCDFELFAHQIQFVSVDKDQQEISTNLLCQQTPYTAFTSIIKTRNICKLVNEMYAIEKDCFFLYFLVLALEFQHTLALTVRKMVT